MRPLLLAILALVVASTLSFGETSQDPWEGLKEFKAGHKIKIVDMSLKSWQGRLVSVSDEAITIREMWKQQEITVERARVFRVADLERSKRARNALIGFAIGSVAGVALGTKAQTDVEAAVIACSWFGGGIGLAVGALMPAHPTIYRAPPSAAGKGTDLENSVRGLEVPRKAETLD